jgi:predicted phage gp36 major capsid-like protein
MDIDTELETKAGIPHDAVVTHADMMRAFEAFKETNDERLARRDSDVVLEEKLARINATLDAQARRLDDITLKSARPALGAERMRAGAPEHKAAFEAYVRSGETMNLRALEMKAMSIGSNTDGGYLVPPEVEHTIGQRLAAISPIRGIAGVRTISGSVYKKPFITTGPAVGWVGETDARAQTASPVSTSCPSRQWSSTRSPPRLRACSRIRSSTSSNGSRRRSSRSSPCRRAPPSLTATAATSRRAS